jgi:MFS transporter, ACS family, tartrate transporter
MTEQGEVFTKCAWRLIPFMLLLYLFSNIDRVNVGFAALTMNKDLGFSPSVYGFGAGIFLISYSLFQVPANLFLARIGPRRGVAIILVIWGAVSAANAFIFNPLSFYAVRFALGIAEAGFFPLMLLYLSSWFPKAYLGRNIARFQVAMPLAFIIGSPLSGLILGLDGYYGLRGWQWLFLIEGLPACIAALAVLAILPDSHMHVKWLTNEEKAGISARLAAEGEAAQRNMWAALFDSRLLGCGLAFASLNFSIQGAFLWLPQIVQGMGFSNRTVGLLVAIPFLFAIVAMMLWARSSDVTGDRIWHFVLPTMLAAAALLGGGISGFNWVVLAAFTIGVSGQLSALPVLNSLPPTFLRGSAAAGGFAFYNAIGYVGGFLGPTILGMLKQQTGDYRVGIAVLGLTVGLSAIIVLFLGRAMTLRTAKIEPAIL